MATQYTCAKCGKQIEEGEFIAILGEAPPSGFFTPIGRADKILNDTGTIYCRECLPEVMEKEIS